MQWYGSTNKSPTKLINATEIKFDMVIYLQMGKTIKEKTPPGNFEITTSKKPLPRNHPQESTIINHKRLQV